MIHTHKKIYSIQLQFSKVCGGSYKKISGNSQAFLGVLVAVPLCQA